MALIKTLRCSSNRYKWRYFRAHFSVQRASRFSMGINYHLNLSNDILLIFRIFEVFQYPAPSWRSIDKWRPPDFKGTETAQRLTNVRPSPFLLYCGRFGLCLTSRNDFFSYFLITTFHFAYSLCMPRFTIGVQWKQTRVLKRVSLFEGNL